METILKSTRLLLFATAVAVSSLHAEEPPVTISGELRKWHKITLRCAGPATFETANPNPFTFYRLNAVFYHPGTGKSYTVPGYYAADGDAAETSATAGNVWHVHFAADETGIWNYSLSFREGAGVAVDPDPAAGVPAGHFNGANGSFEVLATDKTGRDLRGKGRLRLSACTICSSRRPGGIS